MRAKIIFIIFLVSSVLISSIQETYSGYYTDSGFSIDVGPNSAIIEDRYNVYLQNQMLGQQELALETPKPESDLNLVPGPDEMSDITEPEQEDTNTTSDDSTVEGTEQTDGDVEENEPLGESGNEPAQLETLEETNDIYAEAGDSNETDNSPDETIDTPETPAEAE
ncbi:MAG: hypothetical protein ACOX0E_09410 [Syntrophomonadaceae bacterium]|jgi:hypothetical protein